MRVSPPRIPVTDSFTTGKGFAYQPPFPGTFRTTIPASNSFTPLAYAEYRFFAGRCCWLIWGLSTGIEAQEVTDFLRNVSLDCPHRWMRHTGTIKFKLFDISWWVQPLLHDLGAALVSFSHRLSSNSENIFFFPVNLLQMISTRSFSSFKGFGTFSKGCSIKTRKNPTLLIVAGCGDAWRGCGCWERTEEYLRVLLFWSRRGNNWILGLILTSVQLLMSNKDHTFDHNFCFLQ